MSENKTKILLDVVYDLLINCNELLEIVDSNRGIRKRGMKVEKEFINIVEYGLLTLSKEREGDPIRWAQTIQFRCLSKEDDEVVDKIADVINDCIEITGVRKNGFMLHYIVFDDFSSPEYYDNGYEAWRKDLRYRAVYSINNQ